MNLSEFKIQIKSKSFKSTDGGIDYHLISENTLRVRNDPTSMVHYEVK